MKNKTWLVLSIFILCVLCIFNGWLIGRQKMNIKDFIIKKNFEISSDNDNFYFRYPYQFKFNDSKGYFILDNDQLIFLNKKGKFNRNFIIKGQGPGEFTNVESFLMKDNEIAIHQVMPNKMVIFDLTGQVITEFKPENSTSKMITGYNNHFFMLIYNYNSGQAKTGQFSTYNHELVKMSRNGKIHKIGITYPVRWFSKKIGNMLIADTESEFIYTVFDSRYLIFSTSNKYEIYIFDLKKEKIINQILNKKYSRQKFIPLKKDKSKVRRIEMPRPFYSDIQRLFIWKDKILAFTSTYLSDKGIKVDIYNIKAQNLGSFYYKLPNNIKFNKFREMLMSIENKYLFCEGENSDGDIIIQQNSVVLK